MMFRNVADLRKRSLAPAMLDVQISGYDYGKARQSPVSLKELRELEASVGFTDADRSALREASRVISDHAEQLVDGWRKIIGGHDFLAHWFFGSDQKPDERYKALVKKRFVRWVTDTVTRSFYQDWLDYQYEIGLRHTPEKKNATDHAQTASVVPLRFLLTFIARVGQSVRPLLAKSGFSASDVDRIHSAWTKAVILSVALWSQSYAKPGLW
jgi:Protoglobin